MWSFAMYFSGHDFHLGAVREMMVGQKISCAPLLHLLHRKSELFAQNFVRQAKIRAMIARHPWDINLPKTPSAEIRVSIYEGYSPPFRELSEWAIRWVPYRVSFFT